MFLSEPEPIFVACVWTHAFLGVGLQPITGRVRVPRSLSLPQGHPDLVVGEGEDDERDDVGREDDHAGVNRAGLGRLPVLAAKERTDAFCGWGQASDLSSHDGRNTSKNQDILIQRKNLLDFESNEVEAISALQEHFTVVSIPQTPVEFMSIVRPAMRGSIRKEEHEHDV